MAKSRFTQHRTIENPGVHTAFAVSVLRKVVLPIVRILHRPRFEGAEHLPAKGAFLLVSNHPSGTGSSELASFAALYADRFGGERPLAGFAHAASFGWWPLSWVFRQIGAIPSTYDAAERALAKDVGVFVLPGGDHEGFRPFWQRARVDFAGRLGFLKIARKAWVPIVPMAFRGNAAPIVLQARLLSYLFVWPRIAGVKRYGVSLLSAIGAALIVTFVPLDWPFRAAMAWAWLACPLNLLSWVPSTIRITVGEPIPPETLFGDRTDASDETLRRALTTVETSVQGLL